MTFEEYWALSEEERMRFVMGTLAAIASTQEAALTSDASKIGGVRLVSSSTVAQNEGRQRSASAKSSAAKVGRNPLKSKHRKMVAASALSGRFTAKVAKKSGVSTRTVSKVLSSAAKIDKDEAS